MQSTVLAMVEMSVCLSVLPSRAGVYGGVGYMGSSFSPENRFFIFGGFEMRILVHAPAHLSVCFWTSRSRPPVSLPSLTFQADCGSIKGAGVSAEDGTEHYLPW